MAQAARIGDGDWPRTVAAFEGWHALQPERWTDVAAQPGRDAPARLGARSRRDVATSAKVRRRLPSVLGVDVKATPA